MNIWSSGGSVIQPPQWTLTVKMIVSEPVATVNVLSTFNNLDRWNINLIWYLWIYPLFTPLHPQRPSKYFKKPRAATFNLHILLEQQPEEQRCAGEYGVSIRKQSINLKKQ